MSQPEEIVEGEDSSWSVIAWVPPSGITNAEVLSKLAEVQNLALHQRDVVMGLRAELAVARKELADLSATPVARAFRRIDKLEEQREQLLHKLRLGRFGEELDDEIAALKSSVTWRVGRVVVAPASFLKSRARRK